MNEGVIRFLFEVGFLKRLKRTGWAYLVESGDTVAAHSFRVALIAWVLAALDGVQVDGEELLLAALLHDLGEARCGDLNYLAKKYAKCDEAKAVEDALAALPDELARRLGSVAEKVRDPESAVGKLVRDADSLDLLMELRELEASGNHRAVEWMDPVAARIENPLARRLADEIRSTDPGSWWFDRGSDWWSSRR